MNIFFTCKNSLVILLQLYRLLVLIVKKRPQYRRHSIFSILPLDDGDNDGHSDENSEDYDETAVKIVNKYDIKDKLMGCKPPGKLQRRGTAYPRQFHPSTTSTDDISPSVSGSSSFHSNSSDDTVPDKDEMFAGVKCNRDQDKKVLQRKAPRRPHNREKNVKSNPKFKKVIKQTLV